MSAVVSSDPAGAATVEIVIDVVCAETGCARADLLGPDRFAEVVRARHIAIWLTRRLTALSTPEIGRAFGGRDHSTVLSALARINALARVDAVAREELRAMEIEARATAQVMRKLGVPDRLRPDAVAIARRVMGDARATTQVSVAEIEALAAHVLQSAQINEPANEEVA